MIDTAIPPSQSPDKPCRWHWATLAGILVLAFVLRIHALGADSLWHDELWGMEMTVGHDARQTLLPPNAVLTPPPDLLGLEHAAPWWQIWTHMHGDTHPPLFHTMLRCWQAMFGSGEVAVRWPSVIFSMLALVALFDAVRTLNGIRAALWATALMAVAAPQIQYAQEARSYAPLLAEGMVALAAMVRLERRGPSVFWAIMLGLGVLTLPLTHYFSLGAIIALAIYGAIRLRGPSLNLAIAAFVAATACGVILWGHEFLLQRANFANNDLVDWLQEPGKHPALITMGRLVLLPARYLSDSNGLVKIASVMLALLYVLPLLAWKRHRAVAIWWLWLVGTVAPVAFLDFAQKSMHLAYIRYTLLASPAVYVLLATAGEWIPGLWNTVMLRYSEASGRLVDEAGGFGVPQHDKCALRYLARDLVPLGALVWCAIALPLKAYHPSWRPDWRGAFAMISQGIKPGEAVCCVAPADQTIWDPDGVYIELNYYLRPLPPTVLLVRDPALSADQMPPAEMLRDRVGAWAVVTGGGQDAVWPPPGWKVIESTQFEGIGTVQHLVPTEMRGFATGAWPALPPKTSLAAAGPIVP